MNQLIKLRLISRNRMIKKKGWNVASTVSMVDMFKNAKWFNQDLSNWDIS